MNKLHQTVPFKALIDGAALLRSSCTLVPGKRFQQGTRRVAVGYQHAPLEATAN
jgi:hypothetical protein